MFTISIPADNGWDELALVIKFPIKGHFDKNISEVKLHGKPDDQN